MKNDRLYSVGSSQFLSDEQFICQRMRALTLGDCYITDGITEHGEGYVVLAESQDQLAEQGLPHQEAMQRMEQYMDHMPRWMFRGHSPSEIQEA